jgi:phosphoribosyl-ATP pyrophosphohydrolase
VNIRLPDLTIQPGWTAESQLVKITEEFDEVKEAIANQDPINTVREALDLAQTAMTLIEIQRLEYNLNIPKFQAEHEAKLRRKGYMR